MEAGKPSLTAESIAFHRAVHRLVDRPVIFDDPIAARLLHPATRGKVVAASTEAERPGSRFARGMTAVRSRFCEDSLAAAVRDRNVRQYVIVGAGFDTFAYRMPLAEPMRVFEVDFAATQGLKRQRLREAGIVEPGFLTFVSVDLERDSLLTALTAAGVRTNEATVFGLQGLVNYLTPDTLMQIFKMVASDFPQGSEIVFDYAVPPDSVPERARRAELAWLEHAEQLGERILSFIVPSQLKQTMLALGFHHFEQLNAEATNGRFFFARNDGMRAFPHNVLARAAV